MKLVTIRLVGHALTSSTYWSRKPLYEILRHHRPHRRPSVTLSSVPTGDHDQSPGSRTDSPGHTAGREERVQDGLLGRLRSALARTTNPSRCSRDIS